MRRWKRAESFVNRAGMKQTGIETTEGHTMKSLAHDQNGNKLTPSVHRVCTAAGTSGYARQVWAGWSPATDIRWNVYKTRGAALNGDASDTYQNNPNLIAFGIEGWKATP